MKASAVVLALGTWHTAQAEDLIISDAAMTRNGDYMTASMLLDFSGSHLKSTGALVATPMIVNGTDTLLLPSVGVYGRTRWYQSERSGKMPPGGVPGESYRYDRNMAPIQYLANVDYAGWMNASSLEVQLTEYGCAGCRDLGADESFPGLAYYEEIELRAPMLQYEAAVAETLKTRELTGRAYVDFPVNKIVIYPDYRNNTYELGKIIATIDSVKNDPDITVTSIHIAGTASPEGPYDNNVYLAKNRTIALKEYVTNLYNFPGDFIQTSYEPVDWKGLREWLEANNLENRDAILAIVNSDIEPYARNSKIRQDYPSQYEWLLRNVYPALRHSDYRIEYTIRQFSDVAEIAEVIRTAPQKLSLNEMYVLANSLEPGSDEYNEVFETAVRMYPADQTANLNAANSALMRGDLKSAERYLSKAGETPSAIYARGVLHALRGEKEEARGYLRQAAELGVPGAAEFLEKVK